MPPDPRLTRLDDTRVRVENPYGVETTLFADARVTVAEAADALGVSPRTAAAHWAYARAWRLEALDGRPA